MNDFLSQIYITDEPTPLPERLLASSASLKKLYPDKRYTLYNLEDLRMLIEKSFDSSVLKAFDGLVPYAYKANLGRLCILYRFGGWYFDIGITGHQRVDINPNVDALFFRDIQRHSESSWSVADGMIYARPGNSIFIDAIRRIIENIKNNFYGVTPLCPVGPTLIGQAIANFGTSERLMFGDMMDLTPIHSIRNTAFVLPNGEICAWGKRAEGGDLSTLGTKGGNNYNILWRERKIYR